MKKICLTLCLVLCFFLTGCKKDNKKVELTYYVNGEQKTAELEKGALASSALPSEIPHYNLEGWYKDAEFTQSFNEKTAVNENTTVYAKTEQYEFLVEVFDGETKQEAYVFIGDTIHTYFDFTKEGYDLQGLFTDPEFSHIYTLDNLVTEDTKVYLKYAVKKYTVTFDSMGGSDVRKQKVELGSTCEKPNNPNRISSEFICWTLDEEGKNVFNFDTPITSDITLYAQYKEVSYEGLLDELIPDELSTSIELPTGTDTVDYYFSSSDEYTFSSEGAINPTRTNTEVTVTLEVVAKGTTDKLTFSKKVTILPYELRTTQKGDDVLGYISRWNYKGFSESELKTVTMFDLCFAYVLPDGTLDMRDVSYMFQSAVSSIHAVGGKVVLSIQGYAAGTQNFSDCAADPVLRAKLAKSMAEAVTTYHLDGIDIDWEYPGSASRSVEVDRPNYTLLMKAIREELTKLGPDYYLSAAIPGSSWGSARFEMKELVKYFDYFNMMSYDCEDPQAGSHHCALYPSKVPYGTKEGSSIDETLTLWTSQGVPADKICLGMGFYGKRMSVMLANNNGLGQPAANGEKFNNLTYEKIMNNYTKRFGLTATYCFDNDAKSPFIFDTAGKAFTTYDNELSVIYKCEYAKEKGLAGVMIWELGEDPTRTLISAVAQGMKNTSFEYRYNACGNYTFNVGDSIDLKAIYEVENSSLNSGYVVNIIGAATNDNMHITFNQAGSVQIIIQTTDGSFVYSTMYVTVK